MRKRSIIKSFLLFIFFCFLTVGCAAQEKTEEQENGQTAGSQSPGSDVGKNWKVQYRELELKEGEKLQSIVGIGSEFFTFGIQADTVGVKQNIGCLESEKLWEAYQKVTLGEASITLPRNCRIDQLFSDGEKNLYVLGMSYEENGNSYFLISANREDKTQKQTDITAVWQEIWGEESAVVYGAADGSGNVYLGDFWDAHKILVIDTNGQKAAKIDVQDFELYDMACADGRVYCAGRVQGRDTLFRINEQKWTVEEAAVLPESRGTILLQPGGEGILLYGCQDTLYRYDVRTGEGEDIYAWINAGLEGRNVSEFLMDEKGRLLVFLKKVNEGKSIMVVLLEDIPEKAGTSVNPEKADREKIVICGSADDTWLAKAVGLFNVTNEQYEVEIKEYDYDRLLTEIMTGTGPDLFPLKRLGGKESVQKGLAEDLTPYLEKSEKLSKDMLNGKVLELCTIDGILTCIPPSFGITTIFGKESELGSETGWTLEEFMKYVEDHRGLTVMEGILRGDSRMVMMTMIWWTKQQDWIDWENGKACFDQGEFEELLRFAASYEAKYDGEDGSTEERWQEGKVMLYSRPVYDMKRYLWYHEIMEGDMVAIGFPTKDGRPCNLINLYGDYGININSEHKEGAWSFIEYLVSSQTAEKSYEFALPTLNSEIEAMLEEAMEEKKRNISGFDIPAADEDDVAAFRELIENSAMSYGKASAVMDQILYEELSACFYDGRSVEETVQVIQNRMQLYLDENFR